MANVVRNQCVKGIFDTTKKEKTRMMIKYFIDFGF